MSVKINLGYEIRDFESGMLTERIELINNFYDIIILLVFLIINVFLELLYVMDIRCE